jgi:alpha-1,3-rhamnosyltransferase
MNESAIKKPRVSVVVPTYNHGPFIERSLRSIFKQTLAPDELLVIDDGSKDDSSKIIDRLLKECPFPSDMISRPNKGLCATLNEGFEKTSGEYFAYLGSDDLWLPEFLQARRDLLESRPDAILGYGHAYFIDDKDEVFDCTEDWATQVYKDGNVRQMLYAGNAPMSPSVFYRRAAIAKRQWNENSRLEDYEFYLQLCHDGNFAFDNRTLSAWRCHGYNISKDLALILNECLAAQKRCAPLIGWDEKQLDKIQTELRFHYVEEFLRIGNKSKALQLYFANLGGAKSLKKFSRATLRLLIPQFVIQRRKRSVWDNNFERYKDVRI